MNALQIQDRLAQLAAIVAKTLPRPGHGRLITALGEAFSELEMKLVYTRTGWHRPGGVVDAQGNRVADSLSTWLSGEDGEDVLDLFVRYENSGLLATRLCGATHYFTAKTGDAPWDFLQIEVDELREVTDRELFDPQNPPDAVADVLDPLAPLKVEPTFLGPAFYELRGAQDIALVHQGMAAGSYAGSLLALRFVAEWQASSACVHDFCKYFVLRLEYYRDRFGDKRLQATPLPTHVRTLPPLPNSAERGMALAHFLAAFDRAVGYPMAWYFHSTSGAQPALENIARAVFEDVSGAFDYLPERDVAVLNAWIQDPYMF